MLFEAIGHRGGHGIEWNPAPNDSPRSRWWHGLFGITPLFVRGRPSAAVSEFNSFSFFISKSSQMDTPFDFVVVGSKYTSQDQVQ